MNGMLVLTKPLGLKSSSLEEMGVEDEPSSPNVLTLSAPNHSKLDKLCYFNQLSSDVF